MCPCNFFITSLKYWDATTTKNNNKRTKAKNKRSQTHSLYSSGPPFIKRWREFAIGYITIRSLTQSRLWHYLDCDIFGGVKPGITCSLTRCADVVDRQTLKIYIVQSFFNCSFSSLKKTWQTILDEIISAECYDVGMNCNVSCCFEKRK